MFVQNINSILKPGKFPPVLLLFGEEDFLIEESLNRISAFTQSGENSEYNTDIFDCEDSSVSLSTIIDVASSFPFAGDRRVVFAKRFDKLFSGRKSKKMEKETIPLIRYLDSPQPSTMLIITADLGKLKGIGRQLADPKKKTAARKKIKSAKFPFDIILDKCYWIEYPKIWENELFDWAGSRLKAAGYQIKPDALQLLLSNTNPALRDIENELEKLKIYLDDRKNITYEDINFIVGSSRNYNVFELQNAIGAKSLRKALAITEKMLHAGRQEMLILSVLTKYFTALWKLSDAVRMTNNRYELANKAGINPFFLNDYMKALKAYKPDELDNAFKLLTETDIRLKSTGAKPVLIMQEMIISLCSSSN